MFPLQFVAIDHPHSVVTLNVLLSWGRYSSVGITTRYGLDGPVFERWWGVKYFLIPVQTGPVAHPAFYTMGAFGSSWDNAAGAWH